MFLEVTIRSIESCNFGEGRSRRRFITNARGSLYTISCAYTLLAGQPTLDASQRLPGFLELKSNSGAGNNLECWKARPVEPSHMETFVSDRGLP